MIETFQPQKTGHAPGKPTKAGQDHRDGTVYVCNEKIVVTVNVAIATGRPLLIYGPPGSGKSSLASFIANSMNRSYFDKVITSRTTTDDLLWSFDHVRRLRDAHAGKMNEDDRAYTNPQILWWAFAPESARRRGFDDECSDNIREAVPPGIIRSSNNPAVILLDEIDKADTDLPNDLLVALGSKQFFIPDRKDPIRPPKGMSPLTIITSNDDRALPKAFIRRCVVLELTHPDKATLITIAKAHFPQKNKNMLFEGLADRIELFRSENGDRLPSTAEYLDAIQACIELSVIPGVDDHWDFINSAIFLKRTKVD